LQDELIKIWGLRKVTVIPVIIGALRCLSNDSRKYLDEVDPKSYSVRQPFWVQHVSSEKFYRCKLQRKLA